MKMYTNNEQIAKLIGLGFERPKSIVDASTYQEEIDADPDIEFEYSYSIGELLSFCPEVISNDKFDYATINIFHDTINWVVGYDDVDGIMRLVTSDIELIDALYTMCRKLKEEGVI